MTPRLWAWLAVDALGMVMLARLATAMLPWALAVAATIALGIVGALVVLACLGEGGD